MICSKPIKQEKSPEYLIKIDEVLYEDLIYRKIHLADPDNKIPREIVK